MSASRNLLPDALATGSLHAAGLTDLEERVYRQLLRDPGGTLAQVAAAARCGTTAARRAQERLHALGLLVEHDRQLVPAAPDLAIEALILHRQEELERCRLAAAALVADYRESTRRGDDLVEVIAGHDATLRRYTQLLTSARTEVLMLDKPPYVAGTGNPLEEDVLARGVAWQVIYAPEAVALPERVEQLRSWQNAGEQARVCAQVPLKLVMVDRRVALLPLIADSQAAEHTAILVHPCSLLDTLGMLFDVLWQRAVPLRWALNSEAAGDGELDAFDRAMLQLMSAGFKDEAIARHLEVSVRTVHRRLANLMQTNGLTSRFQLGLMASEHSWA
jgi:predicted transcriptional regulator